MFRKLFIITFILYLFVSCTFTTPKFEEMVGKWESDDGAIIQLNKDSTFLIKNFDSYFIFPTIDHNTRCRLKAEGKWSILVLDKSNYIEIITNSITKNNIIIKDKFVTTFEIKGHGGFIYDRAPWYIRIYDGFADYMYFFYRAK